MMAGVEEPEELRCVDSAIASVIDDIDSALILKEEQRTAIKAFVGTDSFSDLQYPDMYNYLINFSSSYSGNSLKAYKNLEGYKWTQSNFVINIQLRSLPAKTCFVVIGGVSQLCC
ncbi:hypothetical protein DPX16_23377 [Anabarilius grahami]|uniref:Uncharacterized protein n=1 Tax=Anabarilius grahami TaxID=495550 RepID=A0A3N0Y140_ANAGA|nr:hypothetical protein DPX16_23377 [Anabarilius grahami]